MLRGLILDLDGVVVDSHPAHKRAWKLFFHSLGNEVPDADLEFVFEGQKREDILRHFLGNLTDEQVKQYGAQKDALFKDAVPKIKMIRGLLGFLEEIAAAGLPASLASSASGSRVNYILRELGLERRFQPVLTGDDVAKGKPDPAIFMLAAARMSVQPQEVLVCEDGVNGVEAAKAAGMKCLAIAANGRGPVLEKAGADKVVPDFSAVRLEELRRMFE